MAHLACGIARRALKYQEQSFKRELLYFYTNFRSTFSQGDCFIPFDIKQSFSRLVNLLEVKQHVSTSVKKIDYARLGNVNQAELKAAAMKGQEASVIIDYTKKIVFDETNADNNDALNYVVNKMSKVDDEEIDSQSDEDLNEVVNMLGKIVFDETNADNNDALNYVVNKMSKAVAMKGQEARIEPYVTLYHWDLPQALPGRYSGWLDTRIMDMMWDFKRRDVARYFFICFCWASNSADVPYIVGYNAFAAHVVAFDIHKTKYEVKLH
ncbi:beta-glucosidase 40 [Tanacetum coccineum]